ncbi:MAG: acyl-CoA carboxylase subunit beta [Bacteroidetes bacterium]|nr:acyl-CoA carboxylase subunit beta [Bacteroidota bacterium]
MKVDELRRKRAAAMLGGGQARIDQQHARGKLAARERLALLLDEGSFEEIGSLVTARSDEDGALGAGVVTGYGRINGRTTYVYAQDFTVMGGSLSEAQAQKIVKIMDMALKNGAPVVGICDSGGARIQEGVASLGGYGDIFLRNVMASGVVPQLTLIMGPCAGGACYSPALTDFIFMVHGTSHMFITGPEVVKAVMYEDVTFDQLGGALVHNSTSGVAHFAAASEEECLAQAATLLSYVPQNNLEDPPYQEPADDPDRADEALDTIVPDSPSKAYDMKEVIRRVMDADTFFEIQAHWAPNVIIGFARLDGRVVGIIAQQPLVLAGALDINASIKGGRFVRFCDCFNIPLVVLEDVPGFLPGIAQEHGGIIRNGAKLLYAFCEATVPRVTVITRKAYGGAYIVMNSRHIRGDLVYAWPMAEMAVMGAEGAVNIVHRRTIEEAQDKEGTRQRLIDEYRQETAHPYIAAGRGFVDEVIEPHETRPRLIAAMEMLQNKRDANPPKKHGNIPL